LKKDFEESVDDYLEFCESVGKEPQKSNFSVSISPKIYDKAESLAIENKVPLNLFIERIIEAI
ncbi:MAG: toxin-antitoxin system HicB family antitoxin, partial [Oscillospiraceae bacterium]|nr:toxin-antitoxin system HicB family antitoxin [Oscillospiraceae bacterium]